MSKVKVMPQSVTIISNIKLDELKLLKKYHPEALTLYDDKTEEPVFAVDFAANGVGNIGKYGIAFASATTDGFAAVEVAIPALWKEENVAETVADLFGVELSMLNALEDGLPAIVRDIATEKAAIVSSVEICG